MARKHTEEQVTSAVVSWREQRKAYFAEKARGEVVSPVPHAPSVRVQKTRSLDDRLRDIVRSEQAAQLARAAGYETEEEANDFDVGDDDQYMPGSPHEQEIDGIPIEDLLLEAHERLQQPPQAEQPPPLLPSSPETRRARSGALRPQEPDNEERPSERAKSVSEALETNDIAALKRILNRL